MEKKSFWEEFKAPFFALAPMEDVTETSFREVVAGISHPDNLQVVFTEFTSVDGLLHEKGFQNVSSRLLVSDSERKILAEKNIKIVVQIWGSEPEHFYKATQLITEKFNFDGIDINMGCPVKKVVKNAYCSALINDPVRAREIILATKDATHLPVSVKTRTGFKRHETKRWIPQVLETQPAALTLHGRYQSMMSEGEASWDEIAKAIEIRNQLMPNCKVIGNGDIDSMEQGRYRATTTGVDGIMVGRGIFKNVGMFTQSGILSIQERLEVMKNHIRLFNQNWEYSRNPQQLKRFFKIYVHSFQGALQMRDKLMHNNRYEEFEEIIANFEQVLDLA